MADNVPLSVVSNLNATYYNAQVGIGKDKFATDKHGYWFLVVDRTTLKIVDNVSQISNTTVPNIGSHNTPDYFLIVATTGVGLDKTPQGDLFKFIDLNGGGRELRHVEQIGRQFNCGSYGTFGYVLVGILGGQDRPGFELGQIGGGSYGPFLTLTLVPTTIGNKTIYTPNSLSHT